jgi:hypothetical protein
MRFHLVANAYFDADDIDEAMKKLAIHLLEEPEHDLFHSPTLFDLHGVIEEEGGKHECPKPPV